MASILSKLPFAKGGGSPQVDVDQEMSIFDHLRELKTRLIICLAAMIVTTVISFFFAEPIIQILIQITPGLTHLTVLHPTENFGTFMEVALLCGFVLALPVISWQIIGFISPGLYPHEKRILYTLLPGITICFIAGAAFAYYLILPAALHFLSGFAGDVFKTEWRAGEYIDMVTQLMFWSGIVFQLPLLMFVGAKLNIIKYDQVKKYRKYSFLIAFVAAAVITPSPDAQTMLFVAVPIYLLYELGLLLTRFAR